MNEDMGVGYTSGEVVRQSGTGATVIVGGNGTVRVITGDTEVIVKKSSNEKGKVFVKVYPTETVKEVSKVKEVPRRDEKVKGLKKRVVVDEPKVEKTETEVKETKKPVKSMAIYTGRKFKENVKTGVRILNEAVRKIVRKTREEVSKVIHAVSHA
ncbi:MAG: hypothetical protein QW353_07550 [Candidatus Korarchaeum sp.]